MQLRQIGTGLSRFDVRGGSNASSWGPLVLGHKADMVVAFMKVRFRQHLSAELCVKRKRRRLTEGWCRYREPKIATNIVPAGSALSPVTWDSAIGTTSVSCYGGLISWSTIVPRFFGAMAAALRRATMRFQFSSQIRPPTQFTSERDDVS
jgi:hypothetical protein